MALLSGGTGILGASNDPNISSGDLGDLPDMKSLSNANISDCLSYHFRIGCKYLFSPVLRFDLRTSCRH